MNHALRIAARLALACGCLVGLGSAAHGQRVREFEAVMQLVAPGLGGMSDGTDTRAVGDPWWDQAESQRQAAEPAAEDGEELADDADPQAQMQAQLRAQAGMMRQVLEQQGLTILRRELSIVRQTCPALERQQRAIVLQAGRQVIEQLVNDNLEMAIGRRRGRPADLEAAIGEAVRAAVTAHAPAGESAAYAAERGLRRERAKRATIAVLVADVDRDAFLDDAERESLAATLADSYRERWRQAVVSLDQAVDETGAALPPGVDRCVEKALGQDRTAEWRARREEARQLLSQARGEPIHMLGNGGMVPFRAPVAAEEAK